MGHEGGVEGDENIGDQYKSLRKWVKIVDFDTSKLQKKVATLETSALHT